jgi:hypothetical protein
LLTLLVAVAFLPSERPTRTTVTGLLLGGAGVLVVLEIWSVVGPGSTAGGSADLMAQLACLTATSCYAGAFVLLRRVMARGLDPLAAMAGCGWPGGEHAPRPHRARGRSSRCRDGRTGTTPSRHRLLSSGDDHVRQPLLPTTSTRVTLASGVSARNGANPAR